MGHNGCDSSQASGPWAIGSGYRFTRAVGGWSSSVWVCCWKPQATAAVRMTVSRSVGSGWMRRAQSMAL